MAQSLTGTLHGNTITLDDLGSLFGSPQRGNDQRVRVVLEPLADTELELSSEEHAGLWQDWVEHGPQGPIGEE